jgi:hypothetical protein
MDCHKNLVVPTTALDLAFNSNVFPVVEETGPFGSKANFVEFLGKLYKIDHGTFEVTSRSPAEGDFVPELGSTTPAGAFAEGFRKFSKFHNDTTLEIIHGVAGSEMGLRAAIATVNSADMDGTATDDVQDDFITFFTRLADKHTFAKVLEAWHKLHKDCEGLSVTPLEESGLSPLQQLKLVIAYTIKCGSDADVEVLFGAKMMITKEFLSDYDHNGPEILVLGELAYWAIQRNICSSKIIEAFTKDCD